MPTSGRHLHRHPYRHIERNPEAPTWDFSDFSEAIRQPRNNYSVRQYIYNPSDAGLSQWPEGTLRLEGIEQTSNPREADIFVCPGNIRIFEQHKGSGSLDLEHLNRLPYFSGNESRHVFFDVSDNFKTPVHLPIIFIRCDVRTWMLPFDPNTIQMGWPVEDFRECIDLPAGGFKYDVSFQGWLSTETRRISAESCEIHRGVKSDIACYDDFCGYIYHSPEGIRRRQEFRRSMKESRVALCGESIPGVLPYRFFEAMSAGRVPLLIGSDYVLPFADEIPYKDFILTLPRDKAYEAANTIRRFVMSHTDERIQEMGQYARKYWERYLNSADWPRLMAEAVQKKMGQPVA